MKESGNIWLQKVSSYKEIDKLKIVIIIILIPSAILFWKPALCWPSLLNSGNAQLKRWFCRPLGALKIEKDMHEKNMM